MSSIKPIAPVRISGTDFTFAQGIRAGNWLFFTGHEATDFQVGIVPQVSGKPGLPLGGQARYRREGDFLFERFAGLLGSEGSDTRHILRLDQYYPHGDCVNPYQRARKAILGNFVPPSTSILMEELLVEGAGMNVSMIAVVPGEDRQPKPAHPKGVPVPAHSGFVATLICGDYVFVAGQMPNNEDMTGLEKAAFRHPSAIWNGTDIRLQTEFLISGRLKPALEAGGSSLLNAIKAQVYLTEINDLPEFMDVWNAHFHDNPCALTVVECRGLALKESKIEINILGLADNGKTKKEIVAHEASSAMRLGPAAVRAGDLLCLSALYAANSEGAIEAALRTSALKHVGSPVGHQMTAILEATREICELAGTDIANVVRANHFVHDLDTAHPVLTAWHRYLSGAPIPFGMVRTPSQLPVPNTDVIVDIWAYAPGRA